MGSIGIHANRAEIHHSKRGEVRSAQRAAVRNALGSIFALKDWDPPLDVEIKAIMRHWLMAGAWFPILYREIADFRRFARHIDDATRLGASIEIKMPYLRAQFSRSGAEIYATWTDYSTRKSNEVRVVWRPVRRVKGSAQLRKVPKEIIALCARQLAEVCEKKYGSPQWDQVGNIIAANWPKVLPQDDGGRDLGDWVYNLVKRHAKRLGHYMPPGAEPVSFEKQMADLVAHYRQLGFV